jgi:hypothetical protein
MVAAAASSDLNQAAIQLAELQEAQAVELKKAVSQCEDLELRMAAQRDSFQVGIAQVSDSRV